MIDIPYPIANKEILKKVRTGILLGLNHLKRMPIFVHYFFTGLFLQQPFLCL